MALGNEDAFFNHLLTTAQQFYAKQQYEAVIKLVNHNLPKLRALKDSSSSKFLIDALMLIGLSCFDLGNYSLAKTYYEEGLRVSSTDAKFNKDSFLHELALVAYKEEKFEESLKLSKDAFSIATQKRKIGANSDRILLHIILLYEKNNQFEDAKELAEILRANCERECNLSLLAKSLNELGMINFNLKNFVTGTNCFVQSLKIKAKLNDSHGAELTFNNLRRCLQIFPDALEVSEVNQILDGLKFAQID
jgi:tetratricopeptide (TPR) repeat protein